MASDERAYRFSVEQYRQVYQRICADKFAGDRAAFMQQFEADVFSFNDLEQAA
jgi:hypothetical protein